MLVSGQSLRSEHVELLAGLVGGALGDRLREAAAHNTSIIALTVAECEQLLSVLDDAPWSLLALRESLLSQLEHRRRKRIRAEKAANYRREQGWPDSRVAYERSS